MIKEYIWLLKRLVSETYDLLGLAGTRTIEVKIFAF